MSRRDRGAGPADYGPNFAATFHLTIALSATYLSRLLDNDDDDLAHVLNQVAMMHTGAGTAVLGVGNHLLDSKWLCGTWDDDAVGTEYTAHAKTALPLEVVGDDADGCVFFATEKFSAIRLVIGTATVDGGLYARRWTYWNGAAWATFTPLAETAGGWAAGVHEVVFQPPADWAATSGAAGEGGLPTGYYAIKFDASTAPDTTAGIASSMECWNPLRCVGSVGTGHVGLPVDAPGDGVPIQDDGEDIVAYHSVPNAANFAAINGRITRKAQVLGQ